MTASCVVCRGLCICVRRPVDGCFPLAGRDERTPTLWRNINCSGRAGHRCLNKRRCAAGFSVRRSGPVSVCVVAAAGVAIGGDTFDRLEATATDRLTRPRRSEDFQRAPALIGDCGEDRRLAPTRVGTQTILSRAHARTHARVKWWWWRRWTDGPGARIQNRVRRARTNHRRRRCRHR